MFGYEILDVVVGLVFVYLLLSLFATALNEYIAAVRNLRGKELARGLGRLLDDLDENQAVRRAFDGIGRKATTLADPLTERLYSHPLIRPLATRRGWVARDWPRFWRRSTEPRLPSYVPARAFAMALLDVLGVHDADASLPAPTPQPQSGAQQPGQQAVATGGVSQAELVKVLELLKRESPLDVSQARGALVGLLGGSGLGASAQMRLLDALTASETQLQKLQESVEVWFNDAMDRISGAYKRTAQGWLFVLGIAIAGCMNADTIEIWRRLQANDALRDAMVRRAEATVAAMDSTRTAAARDTAAAEPEADSLADTVPGAAGAARADTAGGDTATSDSARRAAADLARKNYELARARLDSMELELGWTVEEAVRVGLLRRGTSRDTVPARSPRANAGPAPATAAASDSAARADSARADSAAGADSVARDPRWVPSGYEVDVLFPFRSVAGFLKLIGLLLTATAISLGAPFWFDLLNKVISIRAAGRSPEERPKPPEAPAKRMAERAPR